jgi:hypothetical protein
LEEPQGIGGQPISALQSSGIPSSAEEAISTPIGRIFGSLFNHILSSPPHRGASSSSENIASEPNNFFQFVSGINMSVNLRHLLDSRESQNIIQLPEYNAMFIRPYGVDNEEFTTRELHTLSNLLNEYFMDCTGQIDRDTRSSIETLLSRINIGLEYRIQLDDFRAKLTSQFKELKDSDRSIVKAWLHQLFDIGMYMRRWRGPGHPYPILEHQTSIDFGTGTGGDPVHETLTLESIGRLGEIENKMTPDVYQMVRNLWAYDLRRGNIIIHRQPINRYIRNVVSNNNNSNAACIRVNSTIFIGTTYAYLQFIFRESIQGFSVDIAGIE